MKHGKALVARSSRWDRRRHGFITALPCDSFTSAGSWLAQLGS
jgi:hypothetical protein